MKAKVIYYTLILFGALSACDREDLNELYKMAEENEIMVKRLEETVVDMNDQIQNLHDLTRALMQRLYVTRPVEKSGNGYIITFGNQTNADSIRIMVNDAHTPLLEIDPYTQTWFIDKEDTGVSAVGKDGNLLDNPQVRIGLDSCWEYSADGASWVKTNIRAAGADGAKGKKPEIGINEAGNWTIDAIETAPPVKAWGQNGANAAVPKIGIDSSANPYCWKVSLDGGSTWQPTGVPCQAKNGEQGTLADAPYIKQISVKDDQITFTFSQRLPGTNTTQKIVQLKRADLSISVPVNQLTNCNGQYYCLFGIQQTRILDFNLSGSDIVSVSAINLPEFLTAEITLNSDKKGGKLKLTSGTDAFSAPMRNNFFQLLVINANGQYTSAVVRISRVYKITLADVTESYVYRIYSASDEIVTTQFKYSVYGTGYYTPAKSGIFFYCAQGWFNSLPVTNPYTVIRKPMFVKDVDGNQYRVAHGPNCYWLIGNLKTTRYNDGSAIPLIGTSDSWSSTKEGAYCYYDNDKTKAGLYGTLYNGYAVKTGKLCPKGWRVATDDDWIELEAWLSSVSAESLKINGWRTSYAGGRLKWNVGWDGGSSAMGYLFPLEALPGGLRNETGTFSGIGTQGYWWTSTPSGTTGLYYRKMETGYNAAYRNAYNNNTLNTGVSVRCVRDISDVDI